MYAEKEKEAKARQYKHMTFYEAAKIAQAAEVSEMWLTHFSPSLVHAENYMGAVQRIYPNAQLEEMENPSNWISWKNKKYQKMTGIPEVGKDRKNRK